MLNRRLIRIKIFQAIYAHLQSDNSSLQQSVNYLNKSLTGIQSTFNALVAFPFDLSHYVELNQNPVDKYVTSEESEKQFKLFTNNIILRTLSLNPEVKETIESPSYNWFKDNDFLNLIYKKIINHDDFKAFLGQDITTFEVQKAFLVWLNHFLLEESEDFDNKMEELEMHWIDEKYALQHSVKKLYQSIETEASINNLVIPVISKDLGEDLEFAKDLLRVCILNAKEYEELIAQKTPGWDKERIAKPDIMLMFMALGEFLEFPNIPVKATLNEYLELAKIYSTPQSSKFLNGILDKLLKDLTAEKRILKKGRGLVG
jgi:transcription antitermination protein NusB